MFVLLRNNFFGQQQPQVFVRRNMCDFEECLCLPESHRLFLGLGSGQDKPSGCWSRGPQGGGTDVPGPQATVSSLQISSQGRHPCVQQNKYFSGPLTSHYLPKRKNTHLQLAYFFILAFLDMLNMFSFLLFKKIGLILEECTLFKHGLEGTNISSTLIYFLVIYCKLRTVRRRLLHFYSSSQCQSH